MEGEKMFLSNEELKSINILLKNEKIRLKNGNYCYSVNYSNYLNSIVNKIDLYLLEQKYKR
jgi:hypothetical protein